MSHKEHIYILHELLSKAHGKIEVDEQEILFTARDEEGWVVSTRMFSSKRNLPKEMREAFRNVKILYLDSKGLYLSQCEETSEIFFTKKMPSLERYPAFRHYVAEYIDEMRDWKALLENLP